MANVFYDHAKANLLNGTINLATGPIWVLLVGSGYVPAVATDATRADIGANEITGATGYTTLGQALAGLSVTADTSNHRGKFSATNSTWTTATITAYAAVLYVHNGGTAAGDPLIGYVDFGGAVSSSGGNFTIQWDATNGVLYI